MKYGFSSQKALEGTISREPDGYAWHCADKKCLGFANSDAAMVDAVRTLNSAISFKILETSGIHPQRAA